MRVKMIVHQPPRMPGKEYEVPDEEAARMFEVGIAKPAGPPPVERAVAEPAVERAVVEPKPKRAAKPPARKRRKR